MGLEELVTRLERDADTRVATIEATAREEIAALDSAHARESSAREGEELAKKRTVRAAASERELSAARRHANADVLRARHAVFDRAIARATELLESANVDDAYRATLPARLDDALDHAPSGALVRCREDLAEAARGAVGARAEIRIDAATHAGFVVEVEDVVIDETLAARLARMREAIAMTLAKELHDA